MTKRILGNGCVTYCDYDPIGRVSKVHNRKSDLSVISSFEYERDPVGNPVSILREDGSGHMMFYFWITDKYAFFQQLHEAGMAKHYYHAGVVTEYVPIYGATR